MSLYHVECEGMEIWIEAATFSDAVEIWRENAIAKFGEEYRDEQPDSVTRMHAGPVLRKASND